MKIKKLLALGISLVMALSLCACGGGGSDSGSSSGSGSGSGSASPTASGSGDQTGGGSYQFYGKYEESGEYASMMRAAFLLDLNEDGTAVCAKYAYGQYDASDAASNPTYIASYLSGTWKAVEKDSVPCLQIKLAYKDEAGNESNNITEYAYDVAGVYSFDMTYPVVPGASYTRICTMEGKADKTYADANAFIQANKIEFTAPEYVGTFVDSEKNLTAYLQADGTVLMYAGYDKVAEGKWTMGDTITVSVGGEAMDVTADGSKASFPWSRDPGNGDLVNYTLVCDDITALGAPEVSESTPYTASVDMGGNATTAELTLNGDGTGNLKVFTDMPVTYQTIGSAVVLSVSGELEGYAAQIWPNVNHAYILNEDRSMTAIVNAYDTGSLALLLMDGTNMKVQFPAYNMERDGFTYTLSEDGTALTVTAPGDDVLGAFGQIWQGTGAENWTIDGNTATAA